jgi:hypothetical protein
MLLADPSIAGVCENNSLLTANLIGLDACRLVVSLQGERMVAHP